MDKGILSSATLIEGERAFVWLWAMRRDFCMESSLPSASFTASEYPKYPLKKQSIGLRVTRGVHPGILAASNAVGIIKQVISPIKIDQ